MMVVSPLMDHSDPKGLEKPRIISEIRKTKKCGNSTPNAVRKPRISGSLEWGVDDSALWEPRQVEVRDGSLVALSSASGCPELRIPLRHLNLQPGSRPRAFSLSKQHARPVASFQAGSEQEYERWVKTLAVELMRQTPLEAIRFLDILGITTSMHSTQEAAHRPLRRGASEDNLITIGSGRESRSHVKTSRIYSPNNRNYQTPKTGIESRINKDNVACDKFRNGASLRKVGSHFILNNLKDKSDTVICEEDDGLLEKRENTYHAKSLASDSDESDDVEKEFAELIFKCQQVDKYVPVREKRRLFESLCRGRRLAQSSENLYGSLLSNSSGGQLLRSNRAQSLHDLSRMKCSVAVSEICRYFEQRGKGGDQCERDEASARRRRLQRSERRLSRIKQETGDVEEELWRIQDEMSALDIERSSHPGDVSHRSSAVERYNALESRLSQEEERLNRLQIDAARALKEVELAANTFETALTQSNGDAAENNGRQ